IRAMGASSGLSPPGATPRRGGFPAPAGRNQGQRTRPRGLLSQTRRPALTRGARQGGPPPPNILSDLRLEGLDPVELAFRTDKMVKFEGQGLAVQVAAPVQKVDLDGGFGGRVREGGAQPEVGDGGVARSVGEAGEAAEDPKGQDFPRVVGAEVGGGEPEGSSAGRTRDDGSREGVGATEQMVGPGKAAVFEVMTDAGGADQFAVVHGGGHPGDAVGPESC